MEDQSNKVQCPKCYTYNPEDTHYCNKCGSPLEKTKKTLSYIPVREDQQDEGINFLPGDSFGDRYQIIEEIGRGGMGTVYKAEDKELGITVALKMIRLKYSSNPRIIERLKKETLLARSISHENVIRIYDIGEVNEIKYISMDYIKGQNLKELIHTSGTLTVDTTISITRQICEALKAAHQKGIVHRDLKPQNIMIDNNGKVYTTDFGVAKSIEGEETHISGAIIGTPQYLSPEQAKGEKVNQRSDIYSLGVIIYEMLTGKQPFEAETAAGYIQKHIHEKPPSPSETNPLIPSFLEKIILRCLEKDRKERYQNAGELLKDLEEQELKPQLVLPQTRIKKLLKISYAVIPILLIAVVAYLLIGRKKPLVPPPLEEGRMSVAVMYFENNTGDESLDYMRRALQDYLITDLAQSRYLRVLPDDRLFQILKKMRQLETSQYSTEVLDKIASEENVGYFILGGYGKAGNKFWINVKIRKARSHEHIGTERAEGIGLDSFDSMVDQLTPKIKSVFMLTPHEIASDIDREIGEITTSSPEAYKYYVEGKRYYNEAKFKESIKILEKAIDIDPEFAMAYRLISTNYDYLNNPDKVKEYLQKALALRSRVSEREGYLIQGAFYYNVEGSSEKGIKTYKELLILYPEDERGMMLLAAIYRNQEELDKQQELIEKILHANDKSHFAYLNLAHIFKARGLYDRAIDTLQQNKHLFSNLALYYRYTGSIFLCKGEYDLALIELKNALSLEPDDHRNILLRGHIYHIKGDLNSARKAYQEFLENDDSYVQSLGRLWIGYLYLTQGKFEKCKKEIMLGIKNSQKYDIKILESELLLLLAYLDIQQKNFADALYASSQAREIAANKNFVEYEISALHLQGLAYLGMKRVDEAYKLAEQIKLLMKKTGNKRHMRLYDHLMGMIAQENGLISQSIDYLKNALSLLPNQIDHYDKHAFYHEAAASIFYQNRDLEKAQEQFEKITSLTTGRLKWGDIYARSFYWLGKIYQQKKLKEKAIEQYEKYLQIWKEADPALPEPADARKQVATLRKVSQE